MVGSGLYVETAEVDEHLAHQTHCIFIMNLHFSLYYLPATVGTQVCLNDKVLKHLFNIDLDRFVTFVRAL